NEATSGETASRGTAPIRRSDRRAFVRRIGPGWRPFRGNRPGRRPALAGFLSAAWLGGARLRDGTPRRSGRAAPPLLRQRERLPPERLCASAAAEPGSNPRAGAAAAASAAAALQSADPAGPLLAGTVAGPANRCQRGRSATRCTDRRGPTCASLPYPAGGGAGLANVPERRLRSATASSHR